MLKNAYASYLSMVFMKVSATLWPLVTDILQMDPSLHLPVCLQGPGQPLLSKALTCFVRCNLNQGIWYFYTQPSIGSELAPILVALCASVCSC